jgi:hypothetical protein
MGSTKVTSSTDQSSTTKATAEETEMEKAQLAQFKQYEPNQTQMYQNAYNLGNQLLTSFGSKDSDMWKSLIGGVTNEQQQSQFGEVDRYLKPQLQSQGLYDSGTGVTARYRALTDTANQNAQFNVGTLQNALNLALSGQAQIQSTGQGATSQLASQLAGLRSTTGTGYGVQATRGGVNLGILGNWGGASCWVAAEIFGGWYEPKTISARFYINNLAPEWFKRFYLKYGKQIAEFIHNKPVFKMILKPLFELFAIWGNERSLKEVRNVAGISTECS